MSNRLFTLFLKCRFIVRYASIALIGAALFACSKNEDVTDVNIKVEEAGRLENVVSDIYSITSITVDGKINGSDILLLCDMLENGKLTSIDLSDAEIVSGGSSYYRGDENYYTKDNEVTPYLFYGCDNLHSIKLPDNIKIISDFAFSGCNGLKTMEFPSQIDSIGERAFYNAGLEGEFRVPTSLRSIGKQAFGQTKFSRVIISSDVLAAESTRVYSAGGNSVFVRCKKLTEVVVEEGVTLLDLGFSSCKNLFNVSLPSTLRYLGYNSRRNHNYIFYSCEALAEIELPSKLEYIGEKCFTHSGLIDPVIPDEVSLIDIYAFASCESLVEIHLPAKLKSLEQGAFKDCLNLSSIDLPDNLEELGWCVFQGCTSLVRISIPDAVSIINQGAFADCVSLSEVSFGNNLVDICDSAFAGCIALTSVKLPESLENLGISSFDGCTGLTEVVLPTNLKILQPLTFADCVSLQSVTIGDRLEVVGSSCFMHCPKLEEIELPSSVNQIEKYAFAFVGIKKFIVNWASPLPCDISVFQGSQINRCTLCVPIGARQNYLATSPWTEFADIIES